MRNSADRIYRSTVVNKSQRQNADLILLDIEMPGISGMEIPQPIRRRLQYAGSAIMKSICI